MPKILYEVNNKKSVTVIGLSNDWFSLKPWLHKGQDLNYFDFRRSFSDSGKVAFTYLYLGPISIVRGVWVDQND